MNYKSNQDDFFYQELNEGKETRDLKNQIKEEISHIYSPEMFDSFSFELGTLCNNIINAYNEGNQSGVLENLIEANSINQLEIEKFYQNPELIINIKESKIIQVIFDLAFTNDNQVVNLEEEDLDNDLIDPSDFNDPKIAEINFKVTYNSLVFLLFMSAYSSELSNVISSFNYWEKFFHSIDWFSQECIKIGLLIGTNIIIDATQGMLLEFNRKDQINQQLLDIVVNDTFPDNIAEKITEETSTIAAQILYYFNLVGTSFDNKYIKSYTDSICRVIKYVSDNARVFLVRSINALLQKSSGKDFFFLFQHHEDETPIINDLLINLTCDFPPLRKEIARLIRYGVQSEDIEINDKDLMLSIINFDAFNNIIKESPEDLNELLSLVYDFSILDQAFRTKLFDFNVYFAIIENFDSFSYENRLLSLKIFIFISSFSSTEFTCRLFEINLLPIFFTMLGNSQSTDNQIISALAIFLFKIDLTYHDRVIEEAQEAEIDEILLQIEPSDELFSILRILEIEIPDQTE